MFFFSYTFLTKGGKKHEKNDLCWFIRFVLSGLLYGISWILYAKKTVMYKSNNPKGFVIITDYHYLICLFIRTQSLFFILFNIFIRHWSHLSIFKSIRPWFIRSLRFYLILFVIHAFTCVFQPLQYFIIPFVILFFFNLRS